MKTYIMRALADESRMKLLERISKGEICACKLPGAVKKSQPAVSQHLKMLLFAGLVEVRRHGTNRMYSLSKKGKLILKDINGW
ncbi:MAG: metalloregulator ArsR/SmtB family transcription factor [archaeon]|nr:metalloregulator ArsR/SmtB family transcription factor [archaeon]